MRREGKTEPVRAWDRRARSLALGADPRERGRDAARRTRSRRSIALRDRFRRARSERTPQLVTIVGAPGIGKTPARRRAASGRRGRPRARRLAPGRVPALRRRRHLLAARGDGEGTRQASSSPIGRGGRGEAQPGGRGRIDDEDDAAWVAAPPPTAARSRRCRGGGPDRGEEFAAWRRFLEALAAERPLVLVFEDLHWADEGLLDFVDHLVDWASGVPLLVVCTARPELLARRPGLGRRQAERATMISLSPLSDGETRCCSIAALLEQAVLPADAHAALLERAGGNPLYAEEFVRMLAERGVAAAGDELPVPSRFTASSRPGSTRFRPRRSGSAGRGRPRPDVLARRRRAPRRRRRADRSRSACARWSASSSCGASASPPSRARPSTRSATCSSATSPTAIPRARRIEKHQLASEWIEELGRPEAHAETFAYHYSRALELARAAGQDTRAIESGHALRLPRRATGRPLSRASRRRRASTPLPPSSGPGTTRTGRR